MRLRWLAAVVFWGVASTAATAQHRDTGDSFREHTFVSWDSANGPQIEYMDGQGRAFLWYPGYSNVLVGKWWLNSRGEVCFIYPAAQQKSPADPDFSQELCMTQLSFFETTQSKRDGDPFDLKSGRAPFVTARTDYFLTFADIRARLKK